MGGGEDGRGASEIRHLRSRAPTAAGRGGREDYEDFATIHESLVAVYYGGASGRQTCRRPLRLSAMRRALLLSRLLLPVSGRVKPGKPGKPSSVDSGGAMAWAVAAACDLSPPDKAEGAAVGCVSQPVSHRAKRVAAATAIRASGRWAAGSGQWAEGALEGRWRGLLARGRVRNREQREGWACSSSRREA